MDKRLLVVFVPLKKLKNLLNMYSQKSFSQKLGSCNTTIKSDGCYLVSFCNLLNELGISKMNPLELNEYLLMKGGYSNGCLFNSAKVASLFNLAYSKSTQKPANLCIAETDHYADRGVPQHFVLYRNDAIIDPLDTKPDWKPNTYHIVSYRHFLAPNFASGELRGIDISHWNKVTDWSKIKTDFIITKCTQGVTGLDPTYKERKDKIFGSYHFADGGNPIKEADWYLKNCGDEQLVLDWEIEHKDPVGWCSEFINRIKETGRDCWLYTNDARAVKYDWPDWTFWIARYGLNNGTPNKEPDFKNWTVWQYTSRGSVDGIEGYVDLNIMKNNCEELKRDVEQCKAVIPQLNETIEKQMQVINDLTEQNAALRKKVEEYQGELSTTQLLGLLISKLWKK